jgi:hypothetical protein
MFGDVMGLFARRKIFVKQASEKHGELKRAVSIDFNAFIPKRLTSRTSRRRPPSLFLVEQQALERQFLALRGW